MKSALPMSDILSLLAPMGGWGQKNLYPTWDPGKWNQKLKHLVFCWLYFEPHGILNAGRLVPPEVHLLRQMLVAGGRLAQPTARNPQTSADAQHSASNRGVHRDPLNVTKGKPR